MSIEHDHPPLLRRILHPILNFFFRAVWRMEVEGAENMPADGPLLVAANHCHNVDGPLIALLATRSQPGVVHVQVSGPGGPVLDEVYLGSVVTVPLGDGRAGEPARARIAVTDASDSIEGFLGLRSFVILRADDLQAQLLAAQSAAAALRQELDFIRGTRSWKVTAPLRRLAGRGS